MSQAATKKKKRLGREELTLNLMILPGLIILIIFVFAPLVGSLMAFENYVPAKGLLKSKWVGLSNFEFIFSLPDSKQVFMNTLIIAFSKLVVNIFVPVTFAILLNEIRDDSDIKRRCTMLSLTLFDNPYRVIVCSAATSSDKLLHALKLAKPLFISAFSDQSIEAWILREKQLVLLISEAQNKELCAIREPIASILCHLKQQTGIRFYTAISTLADQTEQAAAAYTDALRALSYHIYERENDVYDDTMVCHQKPSFSPSSIAYDPMITCIEHNDPDEIKRCCAQFVHSLFFTQLPPPDFIRGMCIHVLTNIRVRFLAKHTELSPEEPIRPDDVLLCHTITELIEWLTAGFLSLSESYKRQKKSSDPIIETAKEYIKNHISSNLKAKDVAATVNLSESYFTIYFKTKTGQNFRDYVLNARTDLAKKLLLEQRLSISEIAYATGYQDYRSFSRAFKNVTGISPSDYQNR